MDMTIDEALAEGGAGRFQRRLLGIFGLVWAADAMQVLAIGFTAQGGRSAQGTGEQVEGRAPRPVSRRAPARLRLRCPAAAGPA